MYRKEIVPRFFECTLCIMMRADSIVKWAGSRRQRMWKGLALAAAIIFGFLFFQWPCIYYYRINHTYSSVASPNWDKRPFGTTITCVVLHATVLDTAKKAIHAFSDPDRRISAHFVVDRNGSVTQMVPVECRAWHAGASQLDGVPNVNDYSVGIEIVNRDDGHTPYTDEQYCAVAGIIRLLRSRCSLPDGRIVSHAAVALPQGRKSDPVGFDFTKLYALLDGF